MTSFAELIQQGTAHAWLFIPTAILLGALHGLEPGHSKTMMAAFIVAIRGTVGQAVMLGLSAAFSHTLVVWVVALGGQYLGRGVNAETSEPYFQLASAIIVAGIAAWMLWRTYREGQLEAGHGHHHHGDHHHGHHDHGHDTDHDHHHAHGHSHGPDLRRIDTGHGVLTLEIFEDGVPPRFRIHGDRGRPPAAHAVSLATFRDDGARQDFTFVARDGFVESVEDIPEPHAFRVRLSLGHGNHSHDFDLVFAEEGHDHAGLDVSDGDYMDAHARAHANDIARRFGSANVTNWQIVMFGLTGGLIPCPAAITVLLICLQLKQLTLGVVLVVCFSIGLAVTMVSAGVVASLGVRHVQKRWSGFSTFARRAPYASGALMLLVAAYIGYSGWIGLAAHA